MLRTLHYFSLGLVALLCFWGCKTSKIATGQPKASNITSSDSSEVNYTLIYIIHGDANYLYHDEQGNSLQADKHEMEEALRVARKAAHGEVFIFHQRQENKILWLFPKKDRLFLHYQNGKLIHKKKYSPNSDYKSFASESRLYHKYQQQDSSRLFFLYFGHEIPRDGTISYYHSRPDAKLDTQIFAEGMHSFLSPGEEFDLTVLSTCDNGTPLMVSQLEPLTGYLLASPQNLHLSHIDSKDMLQLEENPELPTPTLANNLAQDTFNRLSQFIQTAVTLSVYDMQAVSSYVGPLAGEYNDYRRQKDIREEGDNTDCAKLPFWDKYGSSAGVKTYYKPPSFGKYAHDQSHSGWGCQR